MKYAYLDWNVFNKLQKLETLDGEEKIIYDRLAADVLDKQIIAPYSNAHISDLHRGYVKDPSYAPGHLDTIRKFTDNFCIVQYWGEKQVRWHYRDPGDFLKSTIEESEYTAASFAELMKFDDEPIITGLNEVRNNLLRLQPVPVAFKQIYAEDPIFNLMYPRTKIEMNMLALCEDLYAFSYRIKTDFALYKHFRKYLNQCKVKYQQLRTNISAVEKQVIGNPAYLTWDGMWDEVGTNKTTSSNPQYDKIVDLFTRTDLRGYRQDERFANLIDDALHTFYAAHCSYFITLDSRCYDKAGKVFQDLKIATLVMTPEEYVNSNS